MLTNLLIENVAVIEKMEIEFGAGFNCITGETAAGKSIIIDAINLILGNRASRDIIRTGATKSIVQAIFYDNSEQLILYREIHLDGRNVCKVNGEFVTVAQLKERAENLVNIHGQHDNQSLLNPAKHIEILDEFAQNDIENNEYVIAKHEFDAVSKQIIDLEENESNKLQRLDMLKFQLNEIELVNPQLGEDAALENQKNTVKNLDAILSALHSAYNSLYEKENSILDELASIHKAFLNISDENANSVQNIKNEISELAHGINSQIEACESGGQSLEEIESRIYAIFSLKRKYGSEIADILNYKNEIATEIHNLENSENCLTELKAKQSEVLADLNNKIEKLYATRKKAAAELSALITDKLAYLQMPKCSFSVDFKDFRTAEFLISTNMGEMPKPLTKIASGGELSRISLAIKTILAKSDSTGTLIFDEIDTGISGRAAQTVAEKLAELGKSRQIFSITHLAQIASMADNHFLISKETVGEKTISKIEKLDNIGRKEELARIIGGAKITDITRQAAAEMLVMEA